MTWSDVVPVKPEHAKVYSTLAEPSREETRNMLNQLVVLKLNGGLGTTMGLHQGRAVFCVSNSSLMSVTC